jgi:hypothetical protein
MLTPDIKSGWKDWLNCARRLQSIASNQEGLAIAKFWVVLKADGTPLLWTSPEVTYLEPKRRVDEEQIKLLVDVFGVSLLENLADDAKGN